MTTPGELAYYDAIGDAGRAHALDKPWSDPDRGAQLLQIGAVLSLLPEPPARVLDCGCGTGWLTWLLHRCGYQATGVDAAERAIELAAQNPSWRSGGPAPAFVAAPFEAMPFRATFDAVLFFDALHHTLDEVAALRGAFEALVPGGIVVTSEPGRGHAAASRQQVEEFGVTERDMPADHIRHVGERIGFHHVRTLPRADTLGRQLYSFVGGSGGSRVQRLKRSGLLRPLRLLRTTEFARRDNGIVVLRKPAP